MNINTVHTIAKKVWSKMSKADKGTLRYSDLVGNIMSSFQDWKAWFFGAFQSRKIELGLQLERLSKICRDKCPTNNAQPITMADTIAQMKAYINAHS